MTSPAFSRRRFLHAASASLLAAPWVTTGVRAASPNGKLRHAAIGVGGMGESDLGQIASHPMVEITALCDVDAKTLEEAKKRFPQATAYKDWRELLAKEGGRIDSVNVSTPDHMHGPIGVAAMALGKHAYIQKPLGQNLYECRRLTLKAKEMNVVTQMGIQVSAGLYERRAIALVQGGAVGKIKEVHSWSNKQWGDMKPVPEQQDEVPADLDWDLWLGVAEARPFIKGYYHPSEWRRRRDFGTGTLGDMGCHMFSAWFRALALAAPVSVRYSGPAPLNATNWAINSSVEYTFKGTAHTAGDTVKVVWYDGTATPPKEVVEASGGKLPDQGSVFLGTDGVLLFPHGGPPMLLPREKFKDYPKPDVKACNHYHEFVDCALKGDLKTGAPFSLAGPLTEAVLLGCLGSPFPGELLEWDSEALKIPNHAGADKLVRRTYRKGWEIQGA